MIQTYPAQNVLQGSGRTPGFLYFFCTNIAAVAYLANRAKM